MVKISVQHNKQGVLFFLKKDSFIHYFWGNLPSTRGTLFTVPIVDKFHNLTKLRIDPHIRIKISNKRLQLTPETNQIPKQTTQSKDNPSK